VHGDVASECFEIIVLSHEICFADKLNHGPDSAGIVDIATDDAGAENAIGFFDGDVRAFLFQNDQGFIHVAAGLFEGLFALHDRDAGFFAKLFYLFGGDGDHFISLLPCPLCRPRRSLTK